MPAAPAQSQEVVIPLNDVTKRVLDNGLTLLVKEDHSAPVATVNVWVKTGYFNETTEWAGISHLLEHMFFKGTPTRPVGKIQDEVKSCGGYWNAGTIYDHTNYYIVLPSSEINRALDIEADALLHSNFPQEEIDKEQEVVIQEILRKYDNPGAMVWEKMMDLLYANHYLGRWRMGQPEQVRRMDREVLVGYYTDRYRPENIILSIVGDVDTDAVLAEAARLLGPMPKGELKHHASPPEPEQTALRFRQDTMDVAQTYLAIGFQAPPVLHEDEHAAEVLSYVLGSGKSARLYREIKERSGLAHSISAGYYALPSAGAFYIEAELDADKIDETRRAIFREIERLKQQPPAAAELERIKARIEYSFLSSMEDVSGQSNNLAYYESLGDYNLLNDYVARLRAVTPEDVQRAAQKYLLIDKAAMQELRPEDKKDDATAAQVEASLREAVAETQFEAQAQTTSAARAAAPAPQSPAQDAPVSLHTLSNGAQVIIKERHRLPLVSVGVYFTGGRWAETADTAGLTSLMLSASLKGTTTRSAEDIQNEIESLGTAIGASALPDYSAWGFSALSRNLAPALDILADVVLNPTFPEQEIEKERQTQLAQIVKTQDSMYAYPFILARRAAYGDHPYGLSSDGREDSVQALTRQQILDAYENLINADGAVLAVVGDVDTGAVLALLEQKFGALPKRAARPAPPPPPVMAQGENIVERNKSQSAQAFAFPAVDAGSPDVPALNILRNIASGMGGRLYDEVREKRNLAYTVVAFLELNKYGGILLNYAATSPENEQQARDLMLQEWKKLAAGEISETEFENSKRYSIGIYQIQLQSNSDLRSQYVRSMYLERGLDYVENFTDLISAVTMDDVKRAAAAHTNHDSAALGVIRAVSE
jgi:zinc protease